MPTYNESNNESKNKKKNSRNDEYLARLEKDLINSMIRVRRRRGVSQTRLAEMCHVKQPLIARMESANHSPQISSILKVLEPLGYTLKIVPLREDQKREASKNKNY